MLVGRCHDHFYQKIFSSFALIILLSCINTSYSRLDEVHVTKNEVDLILGQFAHHGDAFYEAEVKRTKTVLNLVPNDFKARNGLASTYIKLQCYKEAEAEFVKNEQLYPNAYETAANLGVLYKKWVDTQKPPQVSKNHSGSNQKVTWDSAIITSK